MRTPALAFFVGLAFLIPEVGPAATPAQAAEADHASPLEEARSHFHQGVQLYNEASFEAALAEFQKAYQLSSTFRILYNIAQTYFELHDYVNADKILKQYVRDGAGEISSARRIEVDEVNRKLKERIAYLEVVVNKNGADIRIDDMSVGTSPLKSPIPVNAGPRKVAAVKPGYDVAVRLVTVPGTEKVRVILDIPNPVVAQPTEAQPIARSPVNTTTSMTLVPNPAPPDKPTRAGLYTSVAIAGGCAVATGVFGFLAFQAQKDFDKELDRIPNSRGNIDDARSKTKSYAYATDAFAAVTLLSTGVAIYMAVSSGGESGSNKQGPRGRSAALMPTVGGLVLQGTW